MDVKQLMQDIGDSRERHVRNLAWLELWHGIVKGAASDDEVGKLLLEVNGGDFEQTKQFIKAEIERTRLMFTRWAMLARLEFLENQGANHE